MASFQPPVSSRAAAQRLPPLGRLGPFRVERLLGRGGMGAVYAARAPDGTRVALKVVAVRSPGDRDRVRRFLREARLLRRVAHPAIPRILALGRQEPLYYLATEFVDGVTLAELLDQGCRFSLTEALRVAREVGEALAAAHRLKVIHRDVKAQNIMLDRSGRVKLLDFGIAQDVRRAPRSRRGTYLGTPEYASPEQLRGGPLDERTDIYSLGVVLLELLRGEIPWPAAETVDLYRAKLRGLTRRLAAPYPRPLRALLKRFLAPRPWRRFRSMEAAVAALEATRRRLARLDRGPRTVWAS